MVLLLNVNAAFIHLCLAKVLKLSRSKIARELLKFIFLGFHVESSLLHGELSAAGPVGSLVAEAHPVGFDGELRVEMLLAVIEFGETLVLRFLLRLSHLLLDLETASDLGFNLRIGSAIGASNGGLHVGALFDDVE